MKTWFKVLAVKVIKTMSQTALGVIGASAIITDVNWAVVGSAVLLSGLTCILMNLADLKLPEEEE